MKQLFDLVELDLWSTAKGGQPQGRLCHRKLWVERGSLLLRKHDAAHVTYENVEVEHLPYFWVFAITVAHDQRSVDLPAGLVLQGALDCGTAAYESLAIFHHCRLRTQSYSS